VNDVGTVTANIAFNLRDARILEHIHLAEGIAAIHASKGDQWDIDDLRTVTAPKIIEILNAQPTAPKQYIAAALHNAARDFKRKRKGRPRSSRVPDRIGEQQLASEPLSQRVELDADSEELTEQAAPWIVNDERIYDLACSAIQKLRSKNPLWAELLLRKSTLRGQSQTLEEIGAALGISRHKAGRECRQARNYLRKMIRTKLSEVIAENLSIHEPNISLITPKGFKKSVRLGISELTQSVIQGERTRGKARFFAPLRKLESVEQFQLQKMQATISKRSMTRND
jgi:DNA-directed RNA polymerase specialized sigma24 family protein